jgi:DoxX-like family
MKKNKMIYWSSTAILALMMLFSAYSYFTNDAVKGAFVHLGFPSWFRIELATAKLLGALILLIPVVPAAFKLFAYAGFAITFVSAFIAHMAAGDAASHAIMPLVFLGILGLSWFYYSKTIRQVVAV